VLARPRPQVEHARPDPACAGLPGGPDDLGELLRPVKMPGRIGAMPTEVWIPAETSRSRARRRWCGGAVPGSVRRHTRIWVSTEKATDTSARRAASARTSRSRTISSPRDQPEVCRRRDVSRRARVNRKPSAGWYGSVAAPIATLHRA
jgi:hypothetical protein